MPPLPNTQVSPIMSLVATSIQITITLAIFGFLAATGHLTARFIGEPLLDRVANRLCPKDPAVPYIKPHRPIFKSLILASESKQTRTVSDDTNVLKMTADWIVASTVVEAEDKSLMMESLYGLVVPIFLLTFAWEMFATTGRNPDRFCREGPSGYFLAGVLLRVTFEGVLVVGGLRILVGVLCLVKGEVDGSEMRRLHLKRS